LALFTTTPSGVLVAAETALVAAKGRIAAKAAARTAFILIDVIFCP